MTRQDGPPSRANGSQASFRLPGGSKRLDEVLRALDREELVRDICALEAETGANQFGSPDPATHGPNSRMAAAAVLRGARLHAVGNWLTARAAERLAGLEAELASELRQDDPAKSGTDRLFANAEKRIRNAFADVQTTLEQAFRTISEALARKTAQRVSEHHGAEPATNTRQTAREAAAAPVLGLTLDEHFGKLAADATLRFKAAVRKGLANGDGVEQLVKRVEGDERSVEQVEASEPHVHAADAVSTALQVFARLLSPSETGLSSLIQSAVHSLASAVDAGVFDGLGAEDKQTLGWQWVAVEDEKLCDRCSVYDGARWDADYEPVGDAPEYPGDPPEAMHPNCFIGSDAVAPVGLLRSAMKRMYDGEVVRVRTAGHEFTCTPNHPILTRNGWVAAQFIKQGSGIAGYRAGECPSVVEWKHENGVTAFEEVFESLLLEGNLPLREVPVAGPDFHGDGLWMQQAGKSKVSVVSADPLLPHKFNSRFFHVVVKHIFPFRARRRLPFRLPSLGGLDAFIKWAFTAAHRFMSGTSQAAAFFRAAAFHPGELLFAGGPQMNSSSFEASRNQSATAAALGSDSAHTNTRKVKRDGFVPVNEGIAVPVSNAFERGVSLFAGDLRSAANILNGDTGAVEFHNVLSVERFSFHGFVFNLETSDNCYEVNGIIAHNCRCAMVPVDLGEEGGGAPERGLDDYLKQFSRKEQESAFGKAAFRAYDRGDITAGQLLTQRTHELSPEHFAELKDAWEGPLP